MSTEITMPKLSDTMTEGTLISWKKAVGERVERGDIVAEVETDKAIMELEAFASGILLETRARAGDMVPVGTVIAIIGAEGEKGVPLETKELPPSSREQQAGSTSAAFIPEGHEEAREEEYPPPPAVPSGDAMAPIVKASPVVRRLARERGIDLDQVRGSGPEGRVLKEDLEGFLAAPEPEETLTAPPPTEPGERLHHEGKGLPTEPVSEALSGMRAAIAATVAESWRTIPHFSVTVDIDMGGAENLHHGLKDAGAPVSLTDIIIKAAALALNLFPRLNASFAGDRVMVHAEIHAGVAVDVTDGLLLPVIRNCEVLSLREIALRSRDLIARARAGHLRQTEISGGTFTISNLGMFGVTEFTTLIPPGQAGILAVGAITDQAVVRNGHITISRMMKATLSADHRVVDGAYGAGFLGELKNFLENPLRLLV